MVYDFKGKVAFVTGAARGIGRAIALEFARGGATLALNDIIGEAAGELVELTQEAGSPKAKFFHFDIADMEACDSAVDSIIKEFDGLHVLVNNAGVSFDALTMRVKEEDWKRTLDVNLTGTFHLIRAATRPMMKQRGGSIVNIASVVGEAGNFGQAAYAASKGGVIAITKTVAKELASRNIRVNAVAPGFIDTPMTQALSESARQRTFESIPLARIGSPQDIADCVAWLASDKASYVTGSIIRVNGGMYM